MESVFGRYRNLIILVGVLFLQLLGLAVQVKRNVEDEPTRLIRVWTVNAVTPLEKGIVWAQNGAHNLWRNYFYLRGVRQENRDLKAEIERLRIEQVRLSEDAVQAHRLQALLAFKEQYISQTVAAQVIGSSGSEQSRTVYIDKGSENGIKPDMAVITSDGIVGKVLRVYDTTAQVLLIDDQTSGVGAILEKSRLQGIVRGTPAGEVELERVMSDESVQPGEKVLTSGGDQIFPKGLPVGVVSKASPGTELFLNIKIKPAANLSELEEVLVVTKIVEKGPAVEQAGPVRASDILAERLPSVPQKPADTTKPGAVPAKPVPSLPGAQSGTATLPGHGKPMSQTAVSSKPNGVPSAQPAAGRTVTANSSTPVAKQTSPPDGAEPISANPAGTAPNVKSAGGEKSAVVAPKGAHPANGHLPVDEKPKPQPTVAPPNLPAVPEEPPH